MNFPIKIKNHKRHSRVPSEENSYNDGVETTPYADDRPSNIFIDNSSRRVSSRNKRDELSSIKTTFRKLTEKALRYPGPIRLSSRSMNKEISSVYDGQSIHHMTKKTYINHKLLKPRLKPLKPKILPLVTSRR